MAENQIKYNLADDVEDGFIFRIRKSNPVEFFLKYPLQSQINTIVQNSAVIKEVTDKTTEELRKDPDYKMPTKEQNQIKKASETILDTLHEFVTPHGHDEKIEDVLNGCSVQENAKYQDMLKAVFKGE